MGEVKVGKKEYICNCICHKKGWDIQAGTSCDSCYQVHFMTDEEIEKHKTHKLIKKYFNL